MPRSRKGRIDRHGRRFRVTWWIDRQRHRRTFDSEQEATRFIVRLRHQMETEPNREPKRLNGGLTVAEVVDNWYRDHKRNLSSGTRRDYEGRIKREVSRIGSLDASELARNPRDLRAFHATLTPTNARRLHAILRQAFEDAVRHGELERNPCDAARPRKPRPRSA